MLAKTTSHFYETVRALMDLFGQTNDINDPCLKAFNEASVNDTAEIEV